MELSAASACAHPAGFARQQASSRAFTRAEQGLRWDADGRQTDSPLSAVTGAGYPDDDLAAVRGAQGVQLPLVVTRA